jgi:ABC-type nitrate/sulfonate/bicarbonate transport system substrate-binding protein
MSRWLRYVVVITVLLMSGVLVACTAFKPEPDKVTVQLSWFHSVEFAGFYVADQKGYYADENLAVTLKPGGADVLPAQEVADGKADIGVTGGDQLLIARSQGLPLEAIAAIFRQSPVALMALADSGIKTPQDLVGKRIGVISPNYDNNNDIQVLAMLRQAGIDQSKVELVVTEDYSVGSLTSGAMDVYSGFAMNEPVDARLRGIDVNLILPQDYGVSIYANVLFARQQTLGERSDVVQRFVRATFKGYQYAIEHPDEAGDLALKYDNTLDVAFQRASMQAEIPLIDTGDVPIGTMDSPVWQNTNDILLQQGLIKSPVDLNTLFTNKFIEKAK